MTKEKVVLFNNWLSTKVVLQLLKKYLLLIQFWRKALLNKFY